jgi:hypothetical protein
MSNWEARRQPVESSGEMRYQPGTFKVRISPSREIVDVKLLAHSLGRTVAELEALGWSVR